MTPEARGRSVIETCLRLGFAGAGIAEASPSRWGREFAAWLAAGRHGSMAWLARNVEVRLDVTRLLPGARSVVMVADVYESPGAREDAVGRGMGRIARYARGRDYHRVIKDRLHVLADSLRAEHPEAAFRAFVDTAPVMERELAARAGLGWIGKHTLVLHPTRGSYMLLGGVATTLELAAPAEQPAIADHCGTCTRCLDACPTEAISPYGVDASRCISYLTIERRQAISPEFFEAMGDWIFGCDVCQEVCPHNRRAREPVAIRDEYVPRRTGLSLLEVLGWTEDDRRAAFSGSAMKRATLAMMKRNALIAAGNALAKEDDPPMRMRLAEIAEDVAEPEMVRETARAVLARVGAGGAGRGRHRPRA